MAGKQVVVIGAGMEAQFTRIVRRKEAMPKAPVGRARALAEYRGTRGRDTRVWLAGDYLGLPTIESAIETGDWAARQITAG